MANGEEQIPIRVIEDRSVQHTTHEGNWTTVSFFFRLTGIWKMIQIKVRRFQPVSLMNRKTISEVTEDDVASYLRSKCYSEERIFKSMQKATIS